MRTTSDSWLLQLLRTGVTLIQIILRALYLGTVFSPAVLAFIPLKLLSFFQSSSPSEALWWDIFRSGQVIVIQVLYCHLLRSALVYGVYAHRYCICMSGPCITKFCQWVSVRPDLFPLEVCRNLRNLQAHTRAPPYKKVEKVGLKYLIPYNVALDPCSQ